MAEDLLRTRLHRDGSSGTLFVAGELDVASASIFERAVDGAADGDGGEFHLDLSALTFIDSIGVRSLMRAHNKVESLGSRMVVIAPAAPVRRVLEIMGLDSVMDLRDGTRP